jgi:hypothetical protein
VIVCWEKGGSEPIYVCESHAKQLGNSREHGPEARIITAPAEPAANSIKLEREDRPRTREERKPTPEVAGVKSNGSAAPPEASRSLPEARLITAPSEPGDNPVKREDAAQTQKVAGTKSNGSAAPPEASRSLPETKVTRATTDASARSRLRDLTFGNSAKAMVDEAIWNLATGDYEVYRTALQQGKSAREAGQAAGGQLAVIHQKISEYTIKLEALLAESKATINLGETVDKPLEQAVLETIANGVMSDVEKDTAIQQLGAVQEWVKRGLQGDITPLQANEIIMAIGERLNWGGSTDVSEEFKPVYRALYSSLKTAVRTTIPETQNLHDRLTNLYAAKAEMERARLTTKE